MTAESSTRRKLRTLLLFVDLMIAGALLWDLSGAKWQQVWFLPLLPVAPIIGLVIFWLGHGTLESITSLWSSVPVAMIKIVIVVVLATMAPTFWYWFLALFILGALVRLLEKK